MRVHHVKSARKDYPEAGIKQGDSYYWYKFRFSKNPIRSKTYPRRSQLTQSSFLSELYELEDTFQFDRSDLEASVAELIGQIEELRDKCQDSLDNMPEHLQDSSDSGNLLQERIEALDQWISDLEGVDMEIDDELSEDEREAKIEEIMDELSGYSSGL